MIALDCLDFVCQHVLSYKMFVMLVYFHFPIFQFYLIRDDGFGNCHGNNHLWGQLGMGMTVMGMECKAMGMGWEWGPC